MLRGMNGDLFGHWVRAAQECDCMCWSLIADWRERLSPPTHSKQLKRRSDVSSSLLPCKLLFSKPAASPVREVDCQTRKTRGAGQCKKKKQKKKLSARNETIMRALTIFYYGINRNRCIRFRSFPPHPCCDSETHSPASSYLLNVQMLHTIWIYLQAFKLV